MQVHAIASDRGTAASVPLAFLDGQPVVSSNTVAEQCGIQANPMRVLIRKHLDTIESEFGKVHFENAPSPGSSTGQKLAVYYLTEDQATFVVTLCRNSARVVAFKAALVKAFRLARDGRLAPAGSPALDTGGYRIAAAVEGENARIRALYAAELADKGFDDLLADFGAALQERADANGSDVESQLAEVVAALRLAPHGSSPLRWFLLPGDLPPYATATRSKTRPASIRHGRPAAGKRHIGAAVPEELIAKADQLAEARGISRAALLESLIADAAKSAG